MNIEDLAYDFDIKIEFDGDFDGGTYDVLFKYTNSFSLDCKTTTGMVLRQHEIDDLLAGALKLVKLLKPHITEEY
jgi:hypothetical protein